MGGTTSGLLVLVTTLNIFSAGNRTSVGKSTETAAPLDRALGKHCKDLQQRRSAARRPVRLQTRTIDRMTLRAISPLADSSDACSDLLVRPEPK